MGFVVQVLSRGGRVVTSQRFDKPSASIGRGYDCDLQLEDPYVDAHHAQITNSLQGLQLDVLSEEGRSQLDGEDREPGSMPLASGASLVLGKTHLRVLSTFHPVAPVRSLQRTDVLLANWNKPLPVIAITALFIIFSGLETYFSRIKEWDVGPFLFATFTPLLGTAAWVAVAALVTRVVRQDSRVLLHWAVVVGFMLSLIVWNYLEEVIRFNLGDHWLNDSFQVGVLGLLLMALFWLQMRIAFQQKAWVRLLLANTLAWGIIGYTFLGAQSFGPEYDPAPEFEAILLPESLRFVGSESEQEFLQQSEEMFQFSPEALAQGDLEAQALDPEASNPEDLGQEELGEEELGQKELEPKAEVPEE